MKAEELTVWCDDAETAQQLWLNVFCPDGWDIEEPIKVKFNWRKFCYEYRFKLKR